MRNDRFRPTPNLDGYSDFSSQQKWVPQKVPLFATSYPILDGNEGQRLSTLQASEMEDLEMVNRPIVYSVPTYRECNRW